MADDCEDAPAPADRDAARPKMPEPFTLVIFGASGDLAQRKLVPALFDLWQDGLLPPEFRILGYARREKTDEAWRGEMRQAVEQFARAEPLDEPAWAAFASRLRYVAGPYDDAAAFRALRGRLEEAARRGETAANLLFYLATPPGRGARPMADDCAAAPTPDGRRPRRRPAKG